MPTPRIALVTAAAAVAVLAVGGTALALTSGEDAAPPVPAVSAPAFAAQTSTPTSTPTTSPTTTPAPAPSAELSPDQAAAVALERVGGGRVTEIERETEHGRLEWKVEVVDGGVEHDVRVDAGTGTVTRQDTDRDDDRHDD